MVDKTLTPMSQWTTPVGYLLNSFTDSCLIYTYVHHCRLFRVQRLQGVIILSTTAYVITLRYYTTTYVMNLMMESILCQLYSREVVILQFFKLCDLLEIPHNVLIIFTHQHNALEMFHSHMNYIFSFLLQIELATGKFPYTQWKTPFEQLKQVVHEPSPTLPDDGPYSDEFRDFVVQWYS